MLTISAKPTKDLQSQLDRIEALLARIVQLLESSENKPSGITLTFGKPQEK